MITARNCQHQQRIVPEALWGRAEPCLAPNEMLSHIALVSCRDKSTRALFSNIARLITTFQMFVEPLCRDI